MKTENRELLGFTVPINGICETLAEAITAAGSEDAVLKDYNNNVLAHSHYTIARRAIVNKLIELTGVKMKTETTGTGDSAKTVVVEKESEYIARLETELGEETLKEFNSQIASVVGAIPVDYTPGVRGAGATAAPAKKWLAYYDQLVTEDKLDAFCSKHGITVEGKDVEVLKVEVANKVKEIVTAKLAAAAKQALDV